MLVSDDWESPYEKPIRFHIPTTFQLAIWLLGYHLVGYMVYYYFIIKSNMAYFYFATQVEASDPNQGEYQEG